MASLPTFEVAVGVIDGVNVAFTTPSAIPYRAGSVAIFINGQLKRGDYADGWVETNPGTGLVTLDEAPQVGDVVQIFFINDHAPGIDSEELSPLQGKVEETEELSAQFQIVAEVIGVISDVVITETDV